MRILLSIVVSFLVNLLVCYMMVSRPIVFHPVAIEPEHSVYVGTFLHPQQGGGECSAAHYVGAEEAFAYREKLLAALPEVKIPENVIGKRGFSYDKQALSVMRKVVELEEHFPEEEKFIVQQAKWVLENCVNQPRDVTDPILFNKDK